MKLIVKHFFADFHFLGIVLDLDTYTFPLRLGSSCIRVTSSCTESIVMSSRKH